MKKDSTPNWRLYGTEPKSQIVSLDVETYYNTKTGVSLSNLPVWNYVFHPDTFPFLISFKGEDWSWVGDPRDFKDWDKLTGKTIAMHNASFDALVFKRMQQDGVIPESCQPYRFICTADLCAYLRLSKRSLQFAMKYLYKKDVSKAVRTNADGMTARDLKSNSEGWKQMMEYGADDATHCRQIAVDYIDQWPAVFQRVSELNRDASWAGINVDVERVLGTDGVPGALTVLQELANKYLNDMPWYPEFPALSAKAHRAQGRKDGIAVPASLAKDSERGREFFEEHKDVKWVQAIKEFRQVNMLLGKVSNLADGLREDGTFPYQMVFFGANTGRFTGGMKDEDREDSNKFNLLNLPRVELQGIDLRKMIVAPKGHKLFVGDYCITPDTPVLKSDLSWEDAGDIKVGDVLVGFPENLKMKNPHAHRYEKSTVLKTKRLLKPCVKITTNKGEVICSNDHLWVARAHKQGREWLRADQIVPGKQIAWFGRPRKYNTDPDAQWLSGIIDGEASLSSSTYTRADSSKMTARCGLGIGQKEGPVLDKIISVLSTMGHVQKYPIYKNKASDVAVVHVNSELTREIIGSLRPVRFIPKATSTWEGQRTWSNSTPPATVVSVVDVGVCEVVAIETSTKTFVAAGMLSHNCQVEARLLLWYAGDHETLRMIEEEGFNVYEAMAIKLLNMAPEDAKGLKDRDPKTYHMVKGMVLGFGYGMAEERFVVQAPQLTDGKYAPTLEESLKAKIKYRSTNPLVLNLWRRHQSALLSSVYNKDATHRIQMASGRWLEYYDPQQVIVIDEKTKKERMEIVVRQTKGGDHKRIYGAKCVENMCQATGVDILFDAWCATADAGYKPVFTLYDEIVCPVPDDRPEEHGQIISDLMIGSSPWLKGCPLGTEWKLVDRYCK